MLKKTISLMLSMALSMTLFSSQALANYNTSGENESLGVRETYCSNELTQQVKTVAAALLMPIDTGEDTSPKD